MEKDIYISEFGLLYKRLQWKVLKCMAEITSNRNTDTIIICVICEAKKEYFYFIPIYLIEY